MLLYLAIAAIVFVVIWCALWWGRDDNGNLD